MHLKYIVCQHTFALSVLDEDKRIIYVHNVDNIIN